VAVSPSWLLIVQAVSFASFHMCDGFSGISYIEEVTVKIASGGRYYALQCLSVFVLHKTEKSVMGLV